MPELITIAYLVASVLFIFGIKNLASPKTARRGNFMSSFGMLIAIAATLFDQNILSFEWIIIGVIIGSVIGAFIAIRVQMTGMPQMVGILNGLGGGASALVAMAEIENIYTTEASIAVIFSILVGSITISGSFIAFGKLQGFVSGKVIKFPGQNYINLLILAGIIIASIFVVLDPPMIWLVLLILAASLVLGVLFVLPIGGADMPVVVSLLNSYSGIAASATGFVLNNTMLIIAGALVGASGIILTVIMCKGMNRSLMNVLLGGWADAGGGAGPVGDGEQIQTKSVGAEEAAMIFDSAQNVIIVPGYGMAVAQAQHAIRELMNVLESKNINVRFAIHPVAGRMPGHMNVLLAEANVPYENLFALEDINSDFPNTDVVLVVGANDVVNPAARNNPQSPIYGMPILDVDYAKTVIINKRSMSAGYAGIDNELFGYDNAFMYFGDAKSAISDLVKEIKAL